MAKLRRDSLYYVANALKAMELGEADKAAELLWGSTAKALKAVAVKKGLELRSHNQIRDFARSLGAELRDKDIFQGFLLANSLHSNFYESEMQSEDVALASLTIRGLVH